MFHNITYVLATVAIVAAAILTIPLASAKSVGVCVLELDPGDWKTDLIFGDSSWLSLTSATNLV